MVNAKILFLVMALLSLTGCAGFVSLHPLAVPNGNDTIFEPALLGTWEEVKADSRGPKDKYVVDRAESGYKVTVVSGSDKAEGTMHLMKLGDRYLLDVLCPSDGAPPPVHLFVRLRLEKDAAWLSEMDTPWLREQIEASGLRHEVVRQDEQEKVVLTASTAELRRHLLPLASDDRAFAKEGKLRRVAAPTGESNGLRIEPSRKEFPLRIVGATFGPDLRVLLVNLGSRNVTEATLGCC